MIIEENKNILYAELADIYGSYDFMLIRSKWYDLIFIPNEVKYPKKIKDERLSIKLYEFKSCITTQLKENGKIIYY